MIITVLGRKFFAFYYYSFLLRNKSSCSMLTSARGYSRQCDGCALRDLERNTKRLQFVSQPTIEPKTFRIQVINDNRFNQHALSEVMVHRTVHLRNKYSRIFSSSFGRRRLQISSCFCMLTQPRKSLYLRHSLLDTQAHKLSIVLYYSFEAIICWSS
jgi:hypothetical protein